jgi:hypothetical protein
VAALAAATGPILALGLDVGLLPVLGAYYSIKHKINYKTTNIKNTTLLLPLRHTYIRFYKLRHKMS